MKDRAETKGSHEEILGNRGLSKMCMSDKHMDGETLKGQAYSASQGSSIKTVLS